MGPGKTSVWTSLDLSDVVVSGLCTSKVRDAVRGNFGCEATGQAIIERRATH